MEVLLLKKRASEMLEKPSLTSNTLEKYGTINFP